MNYRFPKDLLASFAVIAAVGAVFLYSDTLHANFIRVSEFLGGYALQHPISAGMLFIALAAASALLSLFSSAALIPVAIHIWSNEMTLVLLMAGWMAGGIGAYSIGRYAGLPLVRKLVSAERLEHYQAITKERSRFGLVFLFRFLLPAEITGYILGIARYPLGKYLLVTFLSELPFAFIAIYLSRAFVDKNTLVFLGAGGMTAFALIFVSWKYLPRRTKKS